MNAFVVTARAKLQNSYWFVPSLMAIGAIVLSFVTTTIDGQLGSEWMDDISWIYANKPAGARAVLSTVAGSMITVAGVTFSMTILSISTTTTQIGPRLLNNFMGDKGNQLTLGVFISTFIYCLMVLRTVRNAETDSGDVTKANLTAAFVPHVAVIVGVLMALASVGVLIYFVHHVPESIHISNIIAKVGHRLNKRIDDQFPSRVGEPHEDATQRKVEANLPPYFYSTAKSIRAAGAGYVEFVDGDSLMQIASKHDLVLRVQTSAGDFVNNGSVLLLASPQLKIDEALSKKLAAMFIFGTQRTETQDLRFQFNQLVEVAMRALSPGVNDPFTAIGCMDWLQTALENLATREMPDAYRYDDDQNLRVVAEPVTFAAFASLVFDQLRPYVAADRNASLRMMEMLGKTVAVSTSKSSRRLLVRHACALRRQCRKSQTDTRALQAISAAYRQVLMLMTDAGARKRVQEFGHWIQGPSGEQVSELLNQAADKFIPT